MSSSPWFTLLQVALTAILWGCGTAVGEVPPYFLSYKAASAGRKNDAYQEIEQAMQQGASGAAAVLMVRGSAGLVGHPATGPSVQQCVI